MKITDGNDLDYIGLDALDASGGGFYRWDLESDRGFYSPRFFSMLGYAPDALPQSFDTWKQLIHPDDLEHLIKTVTEYVAGVRQSHSSEYRMRTQNGDWRWILGRGKKVDTPGEGISIVGTHFDITARKSIEDTLRSTEMRLRSLIDSTTDAVFCYEFSNPIPIDLSVDKQVERMYDCVLADCNLVCAKMYGAATIEEVIGKKFTDLFGAEWGGLDKLFRDVIDGGYKIVDGEGVEKLDDGSERYFLNNGYGVVDDGHLLRIWGTFRDVTKQKLSERELLKALRLDSLGIMAGGIAHDFNNLLLGVFANIELARAEIDPDGAASGHLDDALSAFARAKDLTHQLLTFSKGGDPQKSVVSLPKLIRDSVKLALTGSNVKPMLEFHELLSHVRADKGQLSQVFNNLFINSLQAMPGGGELRIESRNCSLDSQTPIALPPGDFVRIEVTDSGTGIPPDILPRIFDPFFTTKQEGSGLGLATCYSIISKHGGHIIAQSIAGTGTSIVILLPAIDDVEDAGEARRAGPVGGSGRILLMEDEELVRNVTRRMIESLGFYVESAKDGAEALALYSQTYNGGESFDVVVVDLTIPGGMGGAELVTKLSEMNPGVKVIATSGYANSDKRGYALDSSMRYM